MYLAVGRRILLGMGSGPKDTKGSAYTERMATTQGARWRRLLQTQRLYRWHLARQQLGRTLDIGCGLGRNMGALGAGSVGVDHNPTSVIAVRERGFEAYTPDEFHAREWEPFDSLLIAHVIEHMPAEDGRALLDAYLPYLAPGGRVLLICPQERGYASDDSHVRFTTGDDLVELASSVGLVPETPRSFPLPRQAGPWFKFNEFRVTAHKSPGGQ